MTTPGTTPLITPGTASTLGTAPSTLGTAALGPSRRGGTLHGTLLSNNNLMFLFSTFSQIIIHKSNTLSLGPASLGTASLGTASPGTASCGTTTLGTASLGPSRRGSPLHVTLHEISL